MLVLYLFLRQTLLNVNVLWYCLILQHFKKVLYHCILDMWPCMEQYFFYKGIVGYQKECFWVWDHVLWYYYHVKTIKHEFP